MTTDISQFPGENPENKGQNLLTCIGSAYTLASHTEPNANEADMLMTKHFLETLAEIALSVASRTVNQ